MAFRSGFISLIGCPNAGKSTLLNALVGQKIAIVSDRAQTTRNRIIGVVTDQDTQMIFLDTPGMTVPKNRLGDYMQKTAEEALRDIEAVVFIIDGEYGVGERDLAVIRKLVHCKAPVIAAVNKVDLISTERAEQIRNELEKEGCFREVCFISALNGTGLEELLSILRNYLVEGPKYYPDDMVTDQPERLICAELIREQALRLIRDEIPHGVGVSTDRIEYRDDRNLADMYATIYCERASHKGIIIGKNGAMLKKIGAGARKEIETLLNCHVNLQIWVKAKEDWRNKPAVLHELGYE